MITSIVEAIYDDYAKVNFANYQLRRKTLTSWQYLLANSKTSMNFCPSWR